MHTFIHLYALMALEAWFFAAMFHPVVLVIVADNIGWMLGDYFAR